MIFERFPAVDGSASLPEGVRPFFCDASGQLTSPLRPSDIGCNASHLRVCQRIAAGAGPALVCEDDLRLPDDLPAMLANIIASAPPRWDIIRLSGAGRGRIRRVAELPGNRALVSCSKRPVLAGAYLLSPAGAAKLLKPRLCIRPFDADLKRPWLFDLHDYFVLPVPIIQNIGVSTMTGARTQSNSRWWKNLTESMQRHAFNLRRSLLTAR